MCVVAREYVDHGQAIQSIGNFGTLPSQSFFFNRQGAFQSLDCAGIQHHFVSCREIIKDLEERGVFGPKRFLDDPNGAFEVRLCFRVVALLPVQVGKIVKRVGDIQVLWPEYFFADLQRALKQWLGSFEIPFHQINGCKIIDESG